MQAEKRLAEPIRVAASTVVNLLVRRQYDVLESMTGGRWLSAVQIREGVEEYGRTLSRPPESAWVELDIAQFPDTEPPMFHTIVPLWTEEEGQSDLTLELRLIEAYPDALEIEIVDLHVM